MWLWIGIAAGSGPLVFFPFLGGAGPGPVSPPSLPPCCQQRPLSVLAPQIRKIAEKFERHPNLPADDDVAKRVFYVADDEIRLVSHLEGRRKKGGGGREGRASLSNPSSPVGHRCTTMERGE